MVELFQSPYRLFQIAVLIACNMIAWTTVRYAMSQSVPLPTVEIAVGDTLEIGIDTHVPQPVYSWILTKDHEFIAAQRNTFFQARQSLPGTYKLDVSIQDEGRTISEYQSFTINVTERMADAPSPPSQTQPVETIVPIVSTVPFADGEQMIATGTQGGIVKIDASASFGSIARYGIDLDGQVDSDGDGNPTNDTDNADTFTEQSGSPLYYFFKPLTGGRTVTINLSSESGIAGSKQYGILFTENSVIGQQPQTESTNIPIDIETNGLTIRPLVQLDATQVDPSVILFEWDFGDRSRSLLARPEHTYAEPGSYDVRVVIRNITTGDVMFAGEEQVMAESTDVLPPETEDPEEEPPVSDGKTGGIVKAFGAFLLLVILAVAAFLLTKKLKNAATGGLQRRIEDAEKKLFEDKKGSMKAEVIDAKTGIVKEEKKAETSHLTLRKEVPIQPTVPAKKEDIVDNEMGKKDFKQQSSVPEVPSQDAGPVPDWLNKAPKPLPSPATSQPKPASPPAPQTKPTPTLPPPPKPPAPKPDLAPPPPKPQEVPVKRTNPLIDPSQTATQSVPAAKQASASDNVATAQDEKERERRRLKRQRYRANRKAKEQEEKGLNEPKDSEEANDAKETVSPDPNQTIAEVRVESLEDEKKND